jgi:4-amino-4-deoxy-L-arabinose transferase-like glycosyltransferase
MNWRGMMKVELHYGISDFKDIDIMAFLPIILPIILVGTLLVLIALIDLYRHRKTRKNALLWMLIILFVNTLGPILYFVIGRKDSERS